MITAFEKDWPNGFDRDPGRFISVEYKNGQYIRWFFADDLDAGVKKEHKDSHGKETLPENKTIRDRFWNKIPTENRVTREEYEKKAVRKSKWAYKELIAFIAYVEKEGMNPYTINGSYAGAMGLCQFMPSNIPILAEDGNKDGSVNLFHHEDAIASIANYLKHYGWKPGISREEAGKVVYHYNHSSYYVEIVLKIIDKLKA